MLTSTLQFIMRSAADLEMVVVGSLLHSTTPKDVDAVVAADRFDAVVEELIGRGFTRGKNDRSFKYDGLNLDVFSCDRDHAVWSEVFDTVIFGVPVRASSHVPDEWRRSHRAMKKTLKWSIRGAMYEQDIWCSDDGLAIASGVRTRAVPNSIYGRMIEERRNLDHAYSNARSTYACVHRGASLGTVEAKVCGRQIAVYDCSLHGKCSITKCREQPAGVKPCKGCEDRRA